MAPPREVAGRANGNGSGLPPLNGSAALARNGRADSRGRANGQRNRGASKTLASYVHFFCAGLAKHAQTGGLVPSQKFLIDKMIAPIPDAYRGQVLELGAGSGAITLRLAERRPLARILACEINPVLARDTELHIQRAGLSHRVRVLARSAEDLMADLRRKGQYLDFILSGIPLGTLDKRQSFALINSIHSTLAPGGMYIQFQHSLLDRKKIEVSFSRLRTVQAFLNLPPAVVYYAEK